LRSHSVACGNGESDAISSAIRYAKFFSRSHRAVIRVYDEAAEGSERFNDLLRGQLLHMNSFGEA
jgi:hypothetical protein